MKAWFKIMATNICVMFIGVMIVMIMLKGEK